LNLNVLEIRGIDVVQKDVEKTISKELKLFNKTQAKLAKQAQNLHRQLALKEAAVKPMLEEAREANVKQEMEDYRRRRDLQVAQRKVGSGSFSAI
jgi:phosphopantetheinyl transferase (holo-ACP synthase)